MFIELTKENGEKQILNVTQIAGVSPGVSKRDSTRAVANIRWAADELPAQFLETYDQVKIMIEEATRTTIVKAGMLQI